MRENGSGRDTEMAPFSDRDTVAGYRRRTERLVPGLADLHRMTGVLLAERAPEDARVLVLGAGGGMELDVLARMQPQWRFVGVDPSAAMLELARETLGEQSDRVQLLEGYIDSAPPGPFDAAVCLLTLHFLPEPERLETLRAIAQRLRPGAPLVVAHHSFAGDGETGERWLQRNAAFAATSGIPVAGTTRRLDTLKARLPFLAPEQDEALLGAAGFSDIELFYAAFTFRGWVSRR